MNLDELRSVRSKERQKDSLQHLRPSFYQEVGEYIADLEAERDRVAERADDPFSSPEVSRLTDEIETARDVVEAIYERRMGKLVKQASLAAAGMAADDEGLTAEEADLFEDLVDRIESNKSRVLDVLEGIDTDPTAGASAEPAAAHGTDPTPEPGVESAPDPDPEAGVDGVADPAGSDSRRSDGTVPVADDSTVDASPPDESDDAPPVPPQEPPAGDESTAEPGSDDSSGVTPADVMGGEGPEIADADAAPRSDSTATNDDVDRVTVRITRDVGAILGVDDREYSLSSDDIVTLPEQNATPLLEGDAAESLE